MKTRKYGQFRPAPASCGGSLFGAWALICTVLSILVFTGVIR